ncbi:hypothetical protein JCM11641_001698 [Rhodosporidiobolus odoratus]
MSSAPAPQNRLTAVLTGAASGISLALARSLLSLSPSTAFPGYNLLLIDLSSTRLTAVCTDLRAQFGEERVDCAVADVTDYEALGRAFKQARENGREGWNGRVDVVGAIAGISQVFTTPDGKDPFLSSARLPDESCAEAPNVPNLKVIDVNLKGVLNTVHLAVAHFRSQVPLASPFCPSSFSSSSSSSPSLPLRGKIICAGSSASLYPFPNEPLYGASKHGVLGLVRSLAPTLYGEHIMINAIAPSLVETGIGNPAAFDAVREKGCLTPMSTVTKAVTEVLLDWEGEGRGLTGQILELCLSHILLRLPPRVPNDDEQRCLDMIWPWEEIERSVGGWKGREGWLKRKGVEIVRE